LKGFVDSSLPLLEKIRFIEFLHIDGWCKKLDLSRLSLLDRLRILRIGDGVTNKSYDLSSLRCLESASVAWGGGINGFSSLRNLKFLALWKAKKQDVSALDLPNSITELRLIHGAFESLRGISRLAGLTRLELSYLLRLHDIDEIGQLNQLQRLEMQNLRSIRSYAAIGSVHSLIELYVEKCAPMETVEWIKGLNKLENLSLDKTNIVNGDLSSVLQLGRILHFAATRRRGYVPPLAEIERILEQRRMAKTEP
jgi:Leucine-rich repeat (LRR) protein